ncbi:MAG: hypothetical protein J6Y62_01685 [Clostridia bacterium]|nr:hypothetical protein [Clostridia bacterium]
MFARELTKDLKKELQGFVKGCEGKEKYQSMLDLGGGFGLSVIYFHATDKYFPHGNQQMHLHFFRKTGEDKKDFDYMYLSSLGEKPNTDFLKKAMAWAEEETAVFMAANSRMLDALQGLGFESTGGKTFMAVGRQDMELEWSFSKGRRGLNVSFNSCLFEDGGKEWSKTFWPKTENLTAELLKAFRAVLTEFSDKLFPEFPEPVRSALVEAR